SSLYLIVLKYTNMRLLSSNIFSASRSPQLIKRFAMSVLLLRVETSAIAPMSDSRDCSSVNDIFGACDIWGAVRYQKCDQFSDLFRATGTPLGNSSQRIHQPLPGRIEICACVFSQSLNQPFCGLCFNETGSHTDNPYAFCCNFV